MSDSVWAIQYALRAAGQRVTADGAFGPQTYAALQATTSRSVLALAAEYPALARRPTSGATLFFSKAEVESAISKAVLLVGEEVRSFLRLMATLENYVVEGGFETSNTGTYRGLAQFSKSSWDDVRARGRFPLPAYEEGVRNAASSMLAAASYWELHRTAYLRTAARKGWKTMFIPNIAYLYHQQGAGGGETFLTTGNLRWPNQSAASITVMVEGRNKVV